jgi:outer membrane protein assembly factor BamB
LVNEKPVKSADLKPGDKIRLGAVILEFSTTYPKAEKKRETEGITIRPRRAPIWPWLVGVLGVLLIGVGIWYKWFRPTPITVQPLSLNELWWIPTQGSIYSSPTLADLNRDAIPEIIVTQSSGLVEAFDGKNGKKIWSYKGSTGFTGSPLATDLSGDGVPELIVSSEDGYVHAINGSTGRKFWISEIKAVGGIVASPLVANIDGKGANDILVAGQDGFVYALDGTRGLLIWNTAFLKASISTTPVLLKINGDNIVDIVVVNDRGDIFAIDGVKGWIIWDYSCGQPISGSPILADINGDKKKEIVVISDVGRLLAFDPQTGITLLDQNLNVGNWETPISCDLTGDKIDEIIMPCRDGTIKAYEPVSRRFLWSYPVCQSDVKIMPPVPVDCTGDKVPDFIVLTENGLLQIVDGSKAWQLQSFDTGESISSSGVVGDINGDGLLDIAFTTTKGTIHALSTNFKTKVGKIIWSTFKGNAKRTGTL